MIFGVWASTRNFGDVLGYQFGEIIQKAEWEWMWGILIGAINVVVWWGVLVIGVKIKKGNSV